MITTYSLYKELAKYGFTSDSTKNSLESLMHQASILKPNESFQDLFPNRDNYNDLALDMLNFVKMTQKHFTVRSGHQERWEITPSQWMLDNYESNIQHLEILGFISQVKPSNLNNNAICILGSTSKTMQIRMDYTQSFIEDTSTDKIIMLSGERYVNPKIDGLEEELKEIADAFKLYDWKKLTETHLIENIYNKSNFFGKFQAYIIDTPAGNLPRPTTQTTVIELVNWLKTHDEIKNIVFVSNQPYIRYQEAIISQVLHYLDYKLDFEVVGSRYIGENAQSAIGSLGSYIFATTPKILMDINQKIDSPQVIELFKEIYESQPLVYSDLVSHLVSNITISIIGEVEPQLQENLCHLKANY